MKQNYYIRAAIELGVIEDTFGYGLTEEGIVKPDHSIQPITNAINDRAEYYSNLEIVRRKRDELLQMTDWVGNEDVPDSTLKTELRIYRQQLRDITSQVMESETLNIEWPIDPRSANVTSLLLSANT
jgi:hypothetical protein